MVCLVGTVVCAALFEKIYRYFLQINFFFNLFFSFHSAEK